MAWSGWGEPVVEGRADTVIAAVKELESILMGADPTKINGLWQQMYASAFYRGGPVLMSAIAGVDQALWDILGKLLDKPVIDLLGGAVRDKMKAYCWVGGDDPADEIAQIEAAVNRAEVPSSSTAAAVETGRQPTKHRRDRQARDADPRTLRRED